MPPQTQRPNTDLVPPAEPMPSSYAQMRRAEQREARWRRKLAPWGARSPVTGVWTLPQRSGGGDKVGFWEHKPEGWGIVAHHVHPEAAPWTKVDFTRTPRQTSGLTAVEQIGALLGGSGEADLGTTPDTTDVRPSPRRYGNRATVAAGLDRSWWESSQQPSTLPPPPAPPA
jgi:hypothetical protein